MTDPTAHLTTFTDHRIIREHFERLRMAKEMRELLIDTDPMVRAINDTRREDDMAKRYEQHERRKLIEVLKDWDTENPEEEHDVDE